MSDTETSQRQENKMGVMPVNKLLLSMSVPMMLSMLVQALYNIVDSMFVAQVSENALTAVSLAFPMQSLMTAIATGTGVGINALLSKSLGEKNFERVNKAATNALFLALCSYIVCALVGIFLSRFFFEVQTSDLALTNPEGRAEIIKQGTDYLSICMVFSFGIFFQITGERLLQSTGKTIYTMFTQGIGAIINIIFDPIFIFGLFGVPRMEAAGAAIATVMGQIVAAIIALVLNMTKNKEVSMSFRKFRPDGQIIKRIYLVGVPSIILAAIGSVMTFGMNKILMVFSSTAAAVFGVYFKLQSFVFMPVFGLNNGMVPIIAYNFGARNPDRITKTIRLSAIYACCIMLIGLAIFNFFPEQILSIFNASEYMLAIGIPALRIISLHFLFAGFCIVTTSVLQAFSRGFSSLLISATRQLIVILPAAYLLSLTGNINLIWLAFPIAEFVSFLMCIFFMRNIFRKEITPMRLSAETSKA